MRRYLAEIYILSTITILLFLLFVFTPAVMPFFLGACVSYLYHPVFEFLERKTGKKRVSAVLTVFFFIATLTIALVFVIPAVVQQVQSFLEFLPKLIAKLDEFIFRTMGKHIPKGFGFDASTVSSLARELYYRIGEIPIGNIIGRVFSGVFSAITITINAVLVPLIAYYFLVNASKIKQIYLLTAPSSIVSELKKLIENIHKSLSNYLIGQMLIAIFVGIYIAVGLTIVGIKYSFLIGFVTGLLNMIPYVGFFTGIVPSLLLAGFDNGTLTAVLGVLIVFLTEVGLENLLYPTVMSRATGVNPLLVLIAIFFGGYLGGVLGIVVAVPVAVMLLPIFESFKKKKESVKCLLE